jgi:hypothetical protein
MKGNFETLTALAEEVERQNEIKVDYRVPSGGMHMRPNDESIFINGEGDFAMNANAHSQLANRLSIPKAYYDRMAEVPSLRSSNVNAWLDESESARTIRTLDGTARAVLSDRFRPFDNYDVLSTMLPTLNEFPDLRVTGKALTETRMYLQIVFPSMEQEVKVGDPVQYGITLRNSEVGHSSVAIESTIWRLVCSNGFIGTSLMKKYHVGRGISDGDDVRVFADETIQADVEAFRLQLRDILRHALSEERFTAELQPLREAAGQMIDKPKEVVENVTRRYGLTNDESEHAMANLIKGGDLSRWGVANSLTALAHDIDNPDRQYEMERNGHDVITLKPSEWETIAA